MKILDRYILTSYLKTFISVFLILMLIFVLQTIWLYIRELAGKDLDISIIFKFLIYFMPKLIPLVLPLTILLASIMVFGDFAENYEFAAMKSTGISLMRAMSGLSVFIVFLGIATFFFSNNIIPWAEYNSFNLRTNIAKLKPAMALAKEQFNEIEGTGYNIKFEDKSIDPDQYIKDVAIHINSLKNVVIHIKGADGRTNATTIKSKSGKIITADTSNVLKLVLFDGNYYHDLKPKNYNEKDKVPFAKSTFETYTINIDLSSFFNNKEDIDDKTISNKYNMLNIRDLNYTLDSLSKENDIEYKAFSNRLYERTITPSLKKIDLPEKGTITRNFIATHKDTITKKNAIIKKDSIYSGSLLDLFDTKKKTQVLNIALNTVRSTSLDVNRRKFSFKNSTISFNKHIIALHEKLALGFACIILFFVGAPLGALIRKGGIGLPMVIAILLFLTYHFIGIFATNSAKSGGLNPVIATWFSTLIMLPLGIVLTKRATADRGLFEFGNFIEPLKRLFKIKDDDSLDYKFLLSFTNERLVDVIKNYSDLGYDEVSRYEAIKILNSRGINLDAIRKNDIEIKKSYDIANTITNDFNDHSKFAIVFYCIGSVLLILHFVFKNNKLPSLASASIQLSLTVFFLFVVYYIKSYLNLNKFYSLINKKGSRPNIFFQIVGLPFYFMSYFLSKRKIKDDLKQNCLDSLK